MTVESPYYLLLYAVLIIVYLKTRAINKIPTLRFSYGSELKQIEDQKTKWVSKWNTIIKWGVLGLIVLALSRPQLLNQYYTEHVEGIDIMLVLDVSGSMRAEDFKPKNRLAVAKQTLRSFIKMRKTDNIGLVTFDNEATTQSPLTNDTSVVLQKLDATQIGNATEGTAIGVAIATGLNRLKYSKAKSKMVILLTDGINNTGEITPLTAAKMAANMNVKIYTIGVGSEEGAPIPIYHNTFGKRYVRDSTGNVKKTVLDEATLEEISSITNGVFFKATNPIILDEIVSDINKMETSPINTEQTTLKTDIFPYILWAIFIILIVNMAMSYFILVIFP